MVTPTAPILTPSRPTFSDDQPGQPTPTSNGASAQPPLTAKPASNATSVAAYAADKIVEATKDLPEDQRLALRWFGGYCRNRNLTRDTVETLLEKPNGGYYSYDSIYASLTGRRSERGENLAPIVAAIQLFQRRVEAPSRIGDAGFIPTRLSKAIAGRCDAARRRKKIAFIFGPSQIGKTESLAEYTRANNHGQTVLVECPTKPSLHSFRSALSHALALPAHHNRPGDLNNKLFYCFDPSILLIVDEAHRALHTDRGWFVLDFLRELYNRCGCGIVLSMTDEGRDLLHKGPQATRLKQLWNRRLAPLQLPKVLPADDLDLFATSHGLPPATADLVKVRIPYLNDAGQQAEKNYSDSPLLLQNRVVAQEGLGVWITILQDACDIAKSQHREVTWGAVLKAYCISQADADCWS